MTDTAVALSVRGKLESLKGHVEGLFNPALHPRGYHGRWVYTGAHDAKKQAAHARKLAAHQAHLNRLAARTHTSGRSGRRRGGGGRGGILRRLNNGGGGGGFGGGLLGGGLGSMFKTKPPAKPPAAKAPPKGTQPKGQQPKTQPTRGAGGAKTPPKSGAGSKAGSAKGSTAKGSTAKGSTAKGSTSKASTAAAAQAKAAAAAQKTAAAQAKAVAAAQAKVAAAQAAQVRAATAQAKALAAAQLRIARAELAAAKAARRNAKAGIGRNQGNSGVPASFGVTRTTVALAADSMMKASTREPVGPHALWHKPGFNLPPYIEHLTNDLIESGKGESEAVAMAVGIMKKWARGIPTGGMKKVLPSTQSAATKAVAQWESLKAKAKSVKSVPGLSTSIGEQAGIALARQDGSVAVSSSGDGPRVTKNALGGGGAARVKGAKTPRHWDTTKQRTKWAQAGVALPDGSFPIPTVAFLRKAVYSVGRAAPGKRAQVRAHIARRAKALGVAVPTAGK